MRYSRAYSGLVVSDMSVLLSLGSWPIRLLVETPFALAFAFLGDAAGWLM